MHIPSLLIAAGPLAMASSGVLQKRCSPIRDEAYQGGYLPPIPCWLASDPACQPYIPRGTEIVIDDYTDSVTVLGVSEACIDTIAEEHAREEDGRKTYGWTEKIGMMDASEDGVLHITNMSSATVEQYLQLQYEGNQ